METGLRELITCTRRERRSATSWLLRTQWCLFHLDTQPNMLISKLKSVPWRPPSLPRRSSIYWYIDQCFDVLIFISTARCSSSRNSLRGITHSPTHPVHILVAVLPPALMVFLGFERGIHEECPKKYTASSESIRVPWCDTLSSMKYTFFASLLTWQYSLNTGTWSDFSLN